MKKSITSRTSATTINQTWMVKTVIWVLIVLLLARLEHVSAENDEEEIEWNFTKASTIINSIEKRMGIKPANKDLIPFLHNIKRRLVDFERTSTNEKDSLIRPVSLKELEAQPTNREVINRKDFKSTAKGLDTFKGHKVRHITDDVEGRLGKWTVLKAMEKLLDMIPSNITAAERICRPGASHWSRSSHTESTEKKCLILGDSISIGYQDYVTEMLEGDCIVHHAPWSGDGGSLDTRYILQCLPLLLSSSVYEPVHYDAIIFNAGLHDVDCCNYSSEYVPLKDYAKNLKKIKNTLLKTGATVAFATSTPIPYNRTRNKRVLQYNKAAKRIMADGKPVKVVDLYKVIKEECDGIVKKCDIFMDDQPNVHFKEWGYLFLAREVTHEFNRMLKHEKTRKQRDSKQENAPPGSLYCIKNAHGQKQDIHGLTGCPGNTTCCLNEYSNSFIGCCMLKDAMDCGDSWHCCPKGTVCDPSCTGKGCVCRKAPWESHASRTTFSLLMKSLNVFWNKIASEFP